MQYRQLKELLETMSEAQLDCDVSIYNPVLDEYRMMESLLIQSGTDVLDDGHPYLTMRYGQKCLTSLLRKV